MLDAFWAPSQKLMVKPTSGVIRTPMRSHLIEADNQVKLKRDERER
jgi:hypothetical protein